MKMTKFEEKMYKDFLQSIGEPTQANIHNMLYNEWLLLEQIADYYGGTADEYAIKR